MKINDVILTEDRKTLPEIFQIIIGSSFFQNNKEVLSLDTALFRGIDKNVSPYRVHEFKKRQKPQDTLRGFHNLANELSQEKLGVPVRNLMFTTKNKVQAAAYGDLYIIIPIGDYNIYYNPDVRDFYTNYGIPPKVLNRLFVESNLDSWYKEFFNSKFNDITKKHQLTDDEKDSLYKFLTEAEYHMHFNNLKSMSQHTPYHYYENMNSFREVLQQLYKVSKRPRLVNFIHLFGDKDNMRQNVFNAYEQLYYELGEKIMTMIAEDFKNYINGIEETEFVDVLGKHEAMLDCKQYVALIPETFEFFLEEYHR